MKTTKGDYVLLTGNQIGGMLTNYIIEGLDKIQEMISHFRIHIYLLFLHNQ